MGLIFSSTNRPTKASWGIKYHAVNLELHFPLLHVIHSNFYIGSISAMHERNHFPATAKKKTKEILT